MEVLALLWVAYLLNQADRQVFNVVLPLIREDLGLSDVAIGSIATVFNLFYAVLVPIGGLVGDRFSRKWIVTGSILFWSVATMFTGLCNGFVMLVLMRSVATGGGEAFFGPANYSLLAQYHDKTRAFAMSIHQTAYYIGIIISGYAAGLCRAAVGLAQAAFYVFGAVGVVHGVIMAVRLKDKKEPAAVAAASAAESKPRLTEGFRMVFTTPTALILTVLLLRADLRADGLSHVDADLSLREFRHGPRGRRLPLDVLHPLVRLRRRAAGRTPLRQARKPASRHGV